MSFRVPLMALALQGCMYGPYDGEVLSSSSSTVSAWGAHPSARAPVTFEARWTWDEAFYPVASTTTSTGWYDAFGSRWYPWSVSTAVPSWAWRGGVTGSRAEVRAVSDGSLLSSYPEDGLDCMVDASVAGTYMLDAQEACGALPSAFLFTSDYRGLPTFSEQSPVDYPREIEVDHSEEIQGVASTASDWYFTHNNDPTLLKIPLTADLADHAPWDAAAEVGMPSALSPLGYDHFGDPDEHLGHVYVPVENDEVGAVAQFDLALNFRGYATVLGATAGWVAIDPTSGLLYSSGFCDVAQVDVYQMQFDGGGVLVGLLLTDQRQLRDVNGVALTLQAIQGGAFSENGNLYLVSDADYGHCATAGTRGVYGFEGATMRKEAWFDVPYLPGNGEELEGIDIRDLTGANVPGIGGQIHLVMLDNDGSWAWPDGDDLYFKHYLANPAELGFL